MFEKKSPQHHFVLCITLHPFLTDVGEEGGAGGAGKEALLIIPALTTRVSL